VGESLLDLLDAREGIVCAVGAGGKKTVLQHLVARHPGRVALTATVFTTRFPADLGCEAAIDEAERLPERVRALDAAARVAYACPSDKPGRHAGVPPALIERIHGAGRFAATFVKADGARMRWIKAPADGEPLLPDACSTIIAVVSARAIGAPLDSRVAHRIDRITAITALEEGRTIEPEHVARLLVHPDGLARARGGRRFVPLINMVDDERRGALARQAARIALDLEPAIERVVLACLKDRGDPRITVIRRPATAVTPAGAGTTIGP
jgi:probable selenium-dependent hydroxylase accessory protein YqeC